LLCKSGQERIRKIRRLPSDKPLTFVTASLSDIAEYAHISDSAYKVLRHLVPGPYTFLLPASKLVPKLVLDPRRRTTGIRVPANVICQELIKALGNPLISMSARLPDFEEAETAEELFEQFDHLVDFVIDDEGVYRSPYSGELSTMIDLTDEVPVILRAGLGIELAEEYL
ncbi:MAG: L-threonylcarbamoyladenylate synthase, partial [Bacteroidota bacterium]|nr:L-threonylcarbamoyladenylate synthase [Bacteroidota bacterium]